MANNPESKQHPIAIIAALIGIIAVIVVVIVFVYVVSPPVSKPAQTAVEPISSPSGDYQPEIIPPSIEMQDPTQTPTVPPTDMPTFTPTVTPTSTFISGPLPDLTVTGISDPVCATEYEGTKLRFAIFVRNIGRARTRSFGSFKTDVFIILGQRHFSLDEWGTEFDGVIGSSITEVFNLNPNADIKFTVVIDLIGNKDFGIKVVVNSGEKPVPELDATNNTLTEYFTSYCY